MPFKLKYAYQIVMCSFLCLSCVWGANAYYKGKVEDAGFHIECATFALLMYWESKEAV